MGHLLLPPSCTNRKLAQQWSGWGSIPMLPKQQFKLQHRKAHPYQFLGISSTGLNLFSQVSFGMLMLPMQASPLRACLCPLQPELSTSSWTFSCWHLEAVGLKGSASQPSTGKEMDHNFYNSRTHRSTASPSEYSATKQRTSQCSRTSLPWP